MLWSVENLRIVLVARLKVIKARENLVIAMFDLTSMPDEPAKDELDRIHKVYALDAAYHEALLDYAMQLAGVGYISDSESDEERKEVTNEEPK